MEPSRQILSHLHRVIIKVGTSVITQEDGSVALGRIGHIVEQIADLRRSGKDVLLVTSGAVGIGTLKLNQQAVLSTPLRNHISGGGYSFSPNVRCFAAAGQSSLMALYEILFSQKQVSVAQVLLTDDDFFCKERTENMRDTLEGLMHLGVVPILNENDVSSRKITINEGSKILFDNDSLAMLVAKELHADLLILLSNVDGVCVEPPSEQNPHPKTIPTITPETSKTISVNINGKSRCGRGGMQAKIEAALNALEASRAVVIASGLRPDVITEIMAGKVVGTLFVSHSEAIDVENNAAESCEEMALKVRAASRVLRNLKPEERAKIIERIADDLLDNEAIILQENQKDVEAAAENNIQQSLRSRLVLTSKKLKTLAKGIRQIAHSADPVGKSISKKEIAEGLVLEKKTVPIGVLLIIFESRPDALPQIAALAIKSGNGLILKGGKEAVHSNAILHHIIVNAVTAETQQLKGSDLITLITSRRDVSDLLKLDQQYIDLVIPRGSSALVKYVKNSTQIPVLGHAEGICHVYIDKEADFEKAKKIVVDAKTDYPSACNAVETILIHSSIPRSQVEELLFDVLSNEHNVNLFGGPRLVSTYKSIPRTNSFQHEYGDLSVTVELVDSADEAIEHINTNSSAHTDVIVTEDKDTANQFLNEVDSACVFHNCSSRFADGYRFGLGAEVGISTSRIHARGPVGVEGLTTTQWTLISSSLDPNSNIVSSYSKGEKQFNFVDEL